MKQCPNAYLADVWPMVRWWTDWVSYQALPYGGRDLMAQPQFVIDVIRTCTETNAEINERTERKLQAEAERRQRELERRARRGY